MLCGMTRGLTDNYAESRQRFLDSARQAGAEVVTYGDGGAVGAVLNSIASDLVHTPSSTR